MHRIIAGLAAVVLSIVLVKADGINIPSPSWTYAITSLGTGVATALGVNVGSAGAPVLFNGAGGTPSSMTATNLSGTAANLTAGNVPASGLTGATLASGVTASSLTSVGTLASLAVTGAITSSSITATGARSSFVGASDPFVLGVKNTAGDGSFFFGASHSATPDGQLSNNGGQGILIAKNSGVIQFPLGYGVGTATFDASGNISSVSDERLKNIVGPFTRGLADLLRMETPIRYHWREESGMETEHEYVGFGAQGAMKGIPEAGSLGPSGYYSFSDRAILAAVVNSIRELAMRTKELETKQRVRVTSKARH